MIAAIAAWLMGLGPVGRYLAAGLVGTIGILALLLAAFTRGERTQALRQQAQAAKATATAVRVNREIRTLPLDARRDELRKWSRG